MNIIGCTHNGYIAVVTESEIAMLTGNTKERLTSGSIVKVSDIYSHYHKIMAADKARIGYADSLRAAATVLENAPSVVE